MAGSLTEGTPEGVPYAAEGTDGALKRAPYAARRTVEIWTAVAAGLVGLVVVSESLTHDIGWNETGPGSGYFPFRVGLLLLATAIVRLFQVRLKAPAFARSAPPRPRRAGPRQRTGQTVLLGVGSRSDPTGGGGDTTTAFVTREELGRSLSVLWPTVALVAAMIPLGCYVPSAVYLAWMMRRHGGHGWLLSAAYGAAVAITFFLVFDLWFGVPLAKGPVEAALGLY